jgi:hypothetical protein
MKKILAVILLFKLLFSFDNNLENKSLLELFNGHYYSYICSKRWNYINMYNNKREDMLSLVAYACLKKRFLTPALDLAKVLKVTKEGRKNATYIVTLFLMKKLLIQLINDNIKIDYIKLPQIQDNTLGIVFGLIEKGVYEKHDSEIIIKNNDTVYKLKVSKNNNVVIDTLKKSQLLKREYYW